MKLPSDLSPEDFIFGLVTTQSRNVAKARSYMDKAATATDEKYLEFIVKALEEDPRCTEAVWELLGLMDWPEDRYLLGLRSVLEMAAQDVGSEGFLRDYGRLSTTPEGALYLEIKHELAWTLLENLRITEALQEWLGMLELDPGDPYHARYGIVPIHLAGGRLESAREVMQMYPHEKDTSAVFAWAQALMCLIENDPAGAGAAIHRGRTLNKHFESLIKGGKVPDEVPESYLPGTKDEATALFLPIMMAWQAHPKALKWLKAYPAGRAN